MAAVLWQDVVALQANLSTVPAAAQMILLAYVNEELAPEAFGGESSARYHLARVYLAAHFGELSRRNGAQDVSSETISRSSITLSYGGTTDDGLAQTSWGRQYADFLAMSPLRLGLSGGC